MRGGTGSGTHSHSHSQLPLPLPGRPNPEKSLEELTHQDIMQLTREDCRRYLKEKGMRRPSWNKSQAIQQVLSLKNLFHSTPDDYDDTKTAKEKENAEDPDPASSSFNASPLPLSAESLKLDWLADAELPVLASQPPSISGQNVFFNASSTKQSGAAQLTIFYSGNVNVYNDVPAEKAQAIMLLAGAANHLPCSRLPNVQLQDAPYPTTCIPAGTPTAQILHKETPVTRKASLQRFLEKKKDRGRCKTSASASKRPPMLMGMFMHPSYWSEAGKKKAATKSTSTSTSTSPSPTRPPQTPSSDEQALVRKSMIEEAS
ncbi:hypothetical protein SUGI_0397360 [Cryptomeria japonica]|uniref:protein TIFY 4B isoform X2 n=1 Tax=Cryptomeria japonica TaxID=3369 RepID=UPI002408D9FA|nr:protein TIFY 4B isoform X2 [Cryptomeria japonica]GLJ21500.1 hypothetical protein SUGI_0397360 [Cryptomeria japonica]